MTNSSSQFSTENLQIEIECALESTSSRTGFINTIRSTVEKLGFSDVDIAQLTGSSGINFITTTLPPKLIDTYKNEQLYINDYVLEYLIHNVTPIFDARAYKHFIHSPYQSPRLIKSIRPYDLMKSYQFHNSYTIPVQPLGSNRKFAFSVMCRDLDELKFEELVNNTKTRLQHIAEISCSFLLNPMFVSAIKKNHSKLLSGRQLDVLTALSKNAKNQNEVAKLLKISPRTVNKHIEEIKMSLGAFSTSNAIYIALKHGLLNDSESIFDI